MSYIIDIGSRFDSAFGGFALANILPRVVRLNPYRFEEFEKEPDWEKMVLTSTNSEVRFGSLPFMESVKSPIHLPFTKNEIDLSGEKVLAPPPLLSFSKAKNLITTPINGGAIEVVERWNGGFWDITMQGILVDMEQHQYPELLVHQLTQFFDQEEVIEVLECRQLEDKLINALYFTDISFNPIEGFQDTVKYTLKARSTNNMNYSLEEL